MSNNFDPDDRLGSRLRERRRQLGLSQAELAKRLDVSPQLIQKQEVGESRISAFQIFKLAEVLGVPVDYFFEVLETSEHAPVRVPNNEDIISPRRHRRLNVMLIEDNANDQLLFVKAVEASRREVDVTCHSSAIEAETHFRKIGQPGSKTVPPDLIFLDVRLPQLSGIDFLRELSRNPNYWNQPIIMLSNSVNAVEMHECYKRNASAFVCKPQDYDQFVKAIDVIFQYWSEIAVSPTYF
ncbi:MAG: helix-turn-helix domain-containing protein [Pseudomonadota bacterium]